MKLIVDVSNNTETLVELSQSDIIQQEIDQAAHDAPRVITCPFELEKIAKRQVALAKLAALGLEEDDLKALGLQHNLEELSLKIMIKAVLLLPQ